MAAPGPIPARLSAQPKQDDRLHLRELVSSKPEQNAQKIDKAPAKMFERYPPGVRSSNN